MKALFVDLHYRGQSVIKKTVTKEEIYSGPNVRYAPDLVILSHHGFDLKASVVSKDIFGKSGLKGMHTQDDAFCFLPGNNIEIQDIVDLKSIILNVL